MLESEAVGEIFWTKSLNIYKAPSDETFDSITIVQVSSLLMIFLLGFFLSIAIFAVENLWYKKSKTEDKTNYYDYRHVYNNRRHF